MLKRKSTRTTRSRGAAAIPESRPTGLSRRGFLQSSGVAGLGLAALSGAPRTAAAQVTAREAADLPEFKKTICQFCSVGCSIWAEVENGVWVGQEPAFESPINQGTHCAKGAAMREISLGERRLKYPMKKRRGRMDPDLLGPGDPGDQPRSCSTSARNTAPIQRLLAGIGQVLQRAGLPVPQVRGLLGHEQRRPPGADLPFHHGRGRRQHLRLRRDDEHLQRHPQFQVDHHHRRQPRRGASRLHAARPGGARERRQDDRRRSALHRAPRRIADEYVRIRPGADIGFLWGLVREIFENGWEDKEYLEQRVWNIEAVREEVEKWTPEEVEHVCGIPPEQTAPGGADAGREPPRHAGLVHGADPAHDRLLEHPRRLDPAAGAGQYRQGGRRRQHLPRP